MSHDYGAQPEIITHPYFTSKKLLLNIPTLSDFTNTIIHNFHTSLPLVSIAVHYEIGQRTTRPRHKQRLYQDMLNF